jgi:hypothetical protein
MLLYGMSMIYGATGSLEIPRVAERIATGQAVAGEVLDVDSHDLAEPGFMRKPQQRRP